MDTPAFLLWALEYTCQVRGFQDGSDPERTERHLRAARAVSDAQLEGRVFEGLCVEPPYGFKIDDALTIFGGITAVEQACRGCPSNAAASQNPDALAGCYGLLPLPEDASGFLRAVDRALERHRSAAEFQRHFTPTQPAWYGLWMRSPLNQDQATLLLDLLADDDLSPHLGRELADLRAGLQVAVQHDLPLHVAFHPHGAVAGKTWRLASHCPVCKGPRPEPTSRHCCICGREGSPVADKKRLARGRRPYFPLARLLGEAAAEEFLLRYSAAAVQRPSPLREQSPRRAVPPDNPPAC